MCAASAVQAQAIPAQVLALYPQSAGEMVYVDLRALRGSSHYPQLKAQVLPERFRQLEQSAQLLGIDFDREVEQLSWAFVAAAEGQPVGFAGVAEGSYSLPGIEREARRRKLSLTHYAGHPLVILGRNNQGQDFVFAFLDSTTAIFGFREEAQQMLERRDRGGVSVLENKSLRELIGQVNGRVPLWFALDTQFVALALKQMLPEAARFPGFDTIAGRVQAATLQFELREGLRGQARIRCQTTADALWFSTLVQAALTYETWRLGETNPELARVLKELSIKRQDDRLELALAIREPDLVALLQKNTFALKF
jgi:hypothetical protein